MVGKRVKVTDPVLVFLLMQGETEGVITSYHAKSFQVEGAAPEEQFPPTFIAHDKGMTIVTPNGKHVWVRDEHVEVLD